MIIGLLATPVLAAIMIPFARRWADYIFLVLATILLAIAITMVPTESVRMLSASEIGLPGDFSFRIDGFSTLMLVLTGFIGFIVAIFSLGWTREYTYYALLAVMFAGMNGLILVSDLFSLYIFLEITSISSFALIALVRSRDGLEAAYKYLMLSAVATAFILLGLFILYGSAGSLAFEEISRLSANPEHAGVRLFCLALLVIGLAIKSGLVPFHGWVPDAYTAAPNPISIALAGIVTKVAGLYTLVRVTFSVFGVTPTISSILMVLGLVSAVVGALAALTQNDGKRMLAFSSISQMGYILLGLGTGSPLGIVGGIFHLFNHAILKSLLFLNTAAIEKATGHRDLSRMGGLASRMPVTGATFAIGSLSVAGIPPLNGFWSKLFILIALFQSGHPVVAFIALITSVVTLGYFLVFQKKALFGKAEARFSDVREAPLNACLPAVILASIVVISGLLFHEFIDLLIEPAANVLSRGSGL